MQDECVILDDSILQDYRFADANPRTDDYSGSDGYIWSKLEVPSLFSEIWDPNGLNYSPWLLGAPTPWDGYAHPE